MFSVLCIYQIHQISQKPMFPMVFDVLFSVRKTKDGSDGEQMAQKIANDRTPLDMAIRREHTEIAELLIAKGTDVKPKSNRDTHLYMRHLRMKKPKSLNY